MPTAIRTVSPTGSYLVDVPPEAVEDIDERVVSFWIPGDGTLLQLSSYDRQDGYQISAQERLDARLRRDQLANVQPVLLNIADCPDVRAIRGQDSEGMWWVYAYAVWMRTAVFATISGPTEVWNGGSWAVRSLCSLRHVDVR